MFVWINHLSSTSQGLLHGKTDCHHCNRVTLPFLQDRLFSLGQTNCSKQKRFCFRTIIPLSSNKCKEIVLGAGCLGKTYLFFLHLWWESLGPLGRRCKHWLSDRASCGNLCIDTVKSHVQRMFLLLFPCVSGPSGGLLFSSTDFYYWKIDLPCTKRCERGIWCTNTVTTWQSKH